MAFIDTGATVGGYGGVNPGAPTGAGVNASAQATVRTPPGNGGYGGSASVRTWVFIFYAIIIGTLFAVGVIFNGKGRK